MSKPIRVAIAGLGSRGFDTYAQYQSIAPDDMEIVAVADTRPERVKAAKAQFHLSDSQCYDSAEALLKEDKLADLFILATQDRQHVAQALVAVERGYDILLEKPVSPELAECKALLAAVEKKGVRVVVCHVLRYTPFYGKLKKLLESGVIGKLVTIQAIENVKYFHQAHSFVRGNWCNSSTTSPMILQKCCHDMDIFTWLVGKPCLSVSSYGSLTLFKEENAPAGSTERCLDGCKAKADCPYDAEKIYMTDAATGVLKGKTGWPCNILALEPNEENILEAIKTGPYGRCVYRCDNNVVDHQVVSAEFEGGETLDFTMTAFTSRGGREVKLMGTMGDIIADMEDNRIRVCRFGEEPEIIDVRTLSDDFSGHGGGDNRMMKELLELLRGKPASNTITSLDVSLQSHLMSLAAEHSRLHGGAAVKLADFNG